MPHRLDPLLRPSSIAVLGASERPGSVGRQTLENLLQGNYGGALYPVNPGRSQVLDLACYPSLSELPEPVEHVVFAVADARVEAALESIIEHGAAAATLMSSLVLAEDGDPPLVERVAGRIRESGLLVCGGNAMGFYNLVDGVWVCGFDTRDHRPGGSVTLISQSGCGMCGIVDVDERIDFNLAVSTGQELSVGLEDYLDFALDLPDTRVVGLFMETARDPAALIAGLEKARDKRIPVVALKVGRTKLSARLAVSHSGAMAGRDDAYQALFDRYGVQRVWDMDQLASALILLAQPHRVAAGGLVALHDSGGERQLLIDLCDDIGVPLAAISEETTERLAQRLDPGLPPVNPLDGWSAGGPDSDAIMADCLAALMSDPDAAMGALVHDRAPPGRIYASYAEYLRRGHQASGKPVCLVSNRQGTGSDAQVVEWTRAGFPVLDGITSFLHGVRCALGHRDFLARPATELPPAPADAVERWTARLGRGPMGEGEALELLADFGLPVIPRRRVDDEDALQAAAAELGYPLVLKSARAGLAHKSEAGGVVLGLARESDLVTAYRDLADRLGPQVLVMPMVTGHGVEMMLGMVRDEQFGPLVTLGFGGTRVEALRDLAWAVPPFDERMAEDLVGRLKLRALLEAGHGEAAVSRAGFCGAAARFSTLVHALAEVLEEFDVNPVIVQADGCLCVDALAVARERPGRCERMEQQPLISETIERGLP